MMNHRLAWRWRLLIGGIGVAAALLVLAGWPVWSQERVGHTLPTACNPIVTGDQAGENGTTHAMTFDGDPTTFFNTSHNGWQYVQIDFSCEGLFTGLRRLMTRDGADGSGIRMLKGEKVAYSLDGTNWITLTVFTATWGEGLSYCGGCRTPDAWHTVPYSWTTWLTLTAPAKARFVRFQWEDDHDALNEIEVDFAAIADGPDLQIVKSLTHYRYDEQAETIDVTYVLHYTNTGNMPAAQVVISDVLPLDTNPVAMRSGVDWLCRFHPNYDGIRHHYVCRHAVGTLSPGSSDAITLGLMAYVPPGFDGEYFVYNLARIGDDGTQGPEQNPADNQSIAVTGVDCSTGVRCAVQWLYCFLSTPWATMQQAVGAAISAVRQDVFDILTFYRLRDETLRPTPAGQRYTRLFYAHKDTIREAIMADAALRAEATALLSEWEPRLRALLDGQGDSVTITAQQVQAVEAFLDHLATAGGQPLAEAMAQERTRQPLSELVGLTLEQARARLLGQDMAVYLPSIWR